MKQGEFCSSDTTLDIAAEPVQNGLHQMIAYINGGVRKEPVIGITGNTFSIPNIFPESGVFQFDLKQPDGTLFDDGSGCPMTIEINAHSCAPKY